MEINDDVRLGLDKFVERLYERKKVAEGDKENLDASWKSYRNGIIEGCEIAVDSLNQVFGTNYPLNPLKTE